MVSFLFGLLFLALALAGVVIRKTYYYVPLTELKRRARHNDPLAKQLYRAAAYSGSLRGILWLFIAITSALGLVLLTRSVPIWLSLPAIVILLWIANSWLPASRVTAIGERLTSLVTPFLAWALNYLHPILSRSVELVEKRYTAPAHTGLFERADMYDLLDQQRSQPDNRLSIEEIDIIKQVLQFDSHKVADIMTPRSKVRAIHANETVGPILINEVHQSGLDYILVQDSPKGEIVGTLSSKRLGLQSTGQVRDVMDETLYYVHENDVLSDALHAFFATNHPLFVVVNSSETYVGIITIQNLVQQLIGHLPGDDFREYADKRAVAHRHAKPLKVSQEK